MIWGKDMNHPISPLVTWLYYKQHVYLPCTFLKVYSSIIKCGCFPFVTSCSLLPLQLVKYVNLQIKDWDWQNKNNNLAMTPFPTHSLTGYLVISVLKQNKWYSEMQLMSN